LESGKNARNFQTSPEERLAVEELNLLTDKPVIYAANVDEASVNTGNKFSQTLWDSVKDEGAEMIIVSASIESQIAELTDPEEKAMFLAEYGLTLSGLEKLIKSSYKILNLITYFTAGVKEVRAWTIQKGWKAPAAAGVIHTDFERGFIKAEVIRYADYIQYRSEQACKEVGKLGVEGKEYVVQDGDVMHFRFNV